MPCVVAAVVLWSTAEVVTRLVVFDITPIQLGAARFAIGAAILCPFLPAELRRRRLRTTPRVLVHAAWIALIGVVLSIVIYQYSLRLAGAGVVAAVYGASPLMAMLLAAPLLGERITLAKTIGLTVGLLGIVLLGMSHRSPVFTVNGLLLAILSALCFAAFTVLVKKFAGAFAGLPITAYCASFGAVYLVLLALIEGHGLSVAPVRSLWLPVLYLGIGPTGLSYLLFFTGLEHVEATHAMSVILLKPPLAAVLAAVWLREPLTWNLAVAMALIMGGLYLVIWLGRYRRPSVATPAAGEAGP